MIQAKLFILSQEIVLLWTDMRYVKAMKSRGIPDADARVVGGRITLCFETRDDTDMLLQWMTRDSGDSSFQEKNKMEEGKICFYQDGFDYPPTKTYEFNDAHLVYYREHSSELEGIPLQTTLTISPAIQNYGALHVEPWNVSYVAPSVDMPFQPLEVLPSTRPKIYDVFYEDLDGKRVKKLKIGSEVYLVIMSENVSGKAVNVDLSDKKHDFLYNEEILEDDILKDLVISGDTHKVLLKVVAQHEGSPGTDDEPSEENQPTNTVPPQTAPEGDKELLQYFLTDAKGTKVEEYEVGDKIILNIETKNRIGDNITIHLEDKSHDFKYNGEILKDDKLSDYSITKNLEKIELEVIVESPKK